MSAFFDRAYVEAVIRAEAVAADVPFEAIVHLSRRADATEARRKAVCRIISEKGCTATTLATVWGCDPTHILALAERAPRQTPGIVPGQSKPPPVASKPACQLRERLLWAHGADRTASILAGSDVAYNADVAAWRTLGRAERG